jgi:hypothetical protein
MATIKQQLEAARLKEAKLQELSSNPEKFSKEEAEKIIEEVEWSPPEMLPHSRRILTGHMSYDEYQSLLKRIKKMYGEEYWNNLDFQRVWGDGKAYKRTLIEDGMYLDQSRAPGNPIGSSILDRLKTRRNRRRY